MNSPVRSYTTSPYFPGASVPFNIYPHSSFQSPYNTNLSFNTTVQSSLNSSSSGYESAHNDTSYAECNLLPASFHVKDLNVANFPNGAMSSNSQVCNHRKTDNMALKIQDINSGSNRKKRRVLSRPQRQEANRRERERMEIINQAYEELRNVLPYKKGRKRQKMSRMDTVDGAIRYIHTLLETLYGPSYDPNWAN